MNTANQEINEKRRHGGESGGQGLKKTTNERQTNGKARKDRKELIGRGLKATQQDGVVLEPSIGPRPPSARSTTQTR